jgi:serpin B
MKKLFMPVVLVALLATSCAETGDSGPIDDSTTTSSPGTAAPVQQGELARADVERATTTDVGAEELAAQVAGNTAFAFGLFKNAVAAGENALLSPNNIAVALTMTYAGARGNTALEMADALNIVDGDRVHAVRNELDLQITSVDASGIPEDEREPFAIEVANSLWGQRGFSFEDEFLEILAENYDAGMNLVDFVADAEAARVAINTWVEDQTAGRIVDLIAPGVVDELTRLVLVSTIWFKASWDEQFDPERTADGDFTAYDGSTATVPFMHGGGMLPFSQGDGYQALRIPYAGDAAMLVVLPDEGRFDEIVQRIDVDLLADVAANSTVTDVDLVMPKFEFRSEFSLSGALKSMGVVDAFDANADFTGMAEEGDLSISDIVHQAFIAVDETGTEAAAATAVIIGLTSVNETESVQFTMDRPFLFIIEHSSTGEILFLGQVTDPSA